MQFIFSSHRINQDEIDIDLANQKGFEGQVLSFASDWLDMGHQTFEVQTSGSTGNPKKIFLSRTQLKASANLTQEFFQLKRGCTALLCLDPTFIAGKMMVVRAIEIGMDLICLPPTADPLKDLSIEAPITFAALVPYQLEAILKSPSSLSKLNKIKTVIVGGAKVSNSIIEKLQSHQTRFFETYGMTETITHVAVRSLNPLENNFKALKGFSFSKDSRDCLVIRAGHLEIEPIVTTDIVELISPTEFQLIGRADNIINTGGIKISPEAVEEKIANLKLPYLNGKIFLITGIKDESLGQRVVLFVEREKLTMQEQEQLLSELKLHLIKWEVPKEIICLKEFARTESGKVIRPKSTGT
jgi:o-succinylbenzoate---CoA ligase